MSTIRVLLVEDHQIVREGVRRMIELEPDIEIAAEAADAEQALTQMKLHSPDVVLMDVKMPGKDGIQLTREITKIWPDTKVIILTTYTDYLREAIDAGAAGYLAKDLRRHELVRAIKSVTEGQAPVQLTLQGEQLKKVTQLQDTTLSERERSVLTMVADGAPDKEIAANLSVSETTVKRTLRYAFDKLGVKNRSEAVAGAIRRHII